MSPWPRYNGFVHVDGELFPVGHVCVQIALVRLLRRAIAHGNPDHKHEVPALFMHQNLDFGPAAERPLGFAGRAVLLFEQDLVDHGAVGRLVLEHQHGPFVQVDAEVYVAQPSVRVVLEQKNVATVVPAKREAARGVLDLRGEPQRDVVFPHAVLSAPKVPRIVVQLVIEVEVVHVLAAHCMLRIVGGNAPQLLARGFRVRQQNTDYVGNVVV